MSDPSPRAITAQHAISLSRSERQDMCRRGKHLFITRLRLIAAWPSARKNPAHVPTGQNRQSHGPSPARHVWADWREAPVSALAAAMKSDRN